MTERSFLHPVFSASTESGAVRFGQPSPAVETAEPKPEAFAMDDIGLARGAVPAEIWDWKRRHP